MFPQRLCLLLSVLFSTVVGRSCSIGDSGQNRNNELVKPEVTDGALFLTPYIEKGQIKKGQELATVVLPELDNVTSFAGYLTVNKTAGSNLFFWLFKSQKGNWEERPLVVWLSGGPGGASVLDLLTDIGPFSVTNNSEPELRNFSYNQNNNLVIFDQPVGTGFSFTQMESGYAKDENDVSRDLYEAIVQLFKLFPSLQKNKVFMTGTSYAGKFIPAIAYKIYKENQVSRFKIKLAGLIIGNGWTDPINQMSYGPLLYKLGLVDRRNETELVMEEDEIRAEIRAGKFQMADKAWQKEEKGIITLTGLKNLYDFVNDKFVQDSSNVSSELDFLNKTRRAIHVGSVTFKGDRDVGKHLENDIMQSVKPLVEELLTAEAFPIMFYSGQLDLKVPYSSSVDFYNSLKWPHADEYHVAKRCQFKVGEEVAGYYKTAGTFTEVLVRSAGHSVPASQPKWGFELLDRFLTSRSSFECT